MNPKHHKNIEAFKISGNWGIQSKQLKEKYSQLTDTDLKLVPGKDHDLLSRMETRLNKNREEVVNIIIKIRLEIENAEIEKSKAFIIVEILEYIPNSVVIKTIIRKTTGNVSAVSFDSGESLAVKISPFDTFIQVIDGKAEILIDDKSYMLEKGQSIIIPAHSRNTIKANVRFKMLSTIIKSGYEE